MRAFLAIASRSFQQMISYRFEAWLGVLISLSMTATFVALWVAVSRKDPAQLATVLAYVVATRLVAEMQIPDLIGRMQIAIKTGAVAIELLKPMPFPLRLAAEQLGRNGWRLVRTVPIYVGIGWLIGVQWPGPATVAAFAVSAVLGCVIALLLQMAAVSVIFFALDVEGIHNFLDFAEAIFSGALIPMWLLPGWFAAVAKALPFQATLYIPGAIFAGHITGTGVWGALGEQLVWSAALTGLVAVLWRTATRKIVVQGG